MLGIKMIVAIIVVVLTTVKKNTAMPIASAQLAKTEASQCEEKKKKEPWELFRDYYYEKFDEYIRYLYRDQSELFVKWESPVDITKNLQRASIPVVVYLSDGRREKLTIFSDTRNSVGGGNFSLNMDLRAKKTAGQSSRTVEELSGTVSDPVPESVPVPIKAPYVKEAPDEWWNNHKDEILKMEPIRLGADYLPKDLKSDVYDIMLNSGLFVSVLCDDEGIFAEVI